MGTFREINSSNFPRNSLEATRMITEIRSKEAVINFINIWVKRLVEVSEIQSDIVEDRLDSLLRCFSDLERRVENLERENKGRWIKIRFFASSRDKWWRDIVRIFFDELHTHINPPEERSFYHYSKIVRKIDTKTRLQIVFNLDRLFNEWKNN